MTLDDVKTGQTWTRRDPSGRVVQFQIIRISRDQWSNRFCIGATAGGKRIRCQVAEMARDGERFALVSEAPTSAVTFVTPSPPSEPVARRCSVEGCERPFRANGMCDRHRQQAARASAKGRAA